MNVALKNALALVAAATLFACNRQPAPDVDYPNLTPITSVEHFQTVVLEAEMPAVVDFYADWCGPCRKLKPILETLAAEWQGKVSFFSVNVDRNAELASRYRIRAIPDVRFFVGGREVGGATGAREEDFWRREMRQLAPPNSDEPQP